MVYRTVKIIFTLLIIFSCSKKENKHSDSGNDAIVAWVGDKTITVKDFRYNYEFGFAHLKKGNNPKKSYLEYMIKEKILTLEGYRLNFDKSEYVQNERSKLIDELLAESLIDKEVRNKIKVTPEEIRKAITKSSVSFKLRYWAEPTLESAQAVCEAMREYGYAEVVGDILQNNPEVKIDVKKFETDYLTHLEISEEIHDVIKDLPYGEISDPIEIDAQYLIVQLLDIRRKGITENEIKSKMPTFQQIIYYQKFKKETQRYTTEFMTPKKIVTKGEAFSRLSKAIIEWEKIKKDTGLKFLESVKQASEDQAALKSLKDHFNKTFMTYEGGELSVREFIDEFDPSYIKVDPDKGVNSREAINNAVALSIRDHFFVKEARQQELQNTLKVKNKLAQWTAKWVYDEARRDFTSDVKVDEQQFEVFFKKNKEPTFGEFGKLAKRDAYLQRALAVLNDKTENLKKDFPVKINFAVLDTITVTDFEKSRWANIQVFNAGTNRPAVPTVDPAWGF